MSQGQIFRHMVLTVDIRVELWAKIRIMYLGSDFNGAWRAPI